MSTSEGKHAVYLNIFHYKFAKIALIIILILAN
jgi:hypothetical protein